MSSCGQLKDDDDDGTDQGKFGTDGSLKLNHTITTEQIYTKYGMNIV